MKRFLLTGGIFIFGIIIGSIISILVFGKLFSDSKETEALMTIAELQDLASDIYESGDYNTSVIVLNYLVKKLASHQNLSDESGIFRTDEGLAHGRLYVLHKREGEKELAEKEYTKAMSLLGSKYKITTKDELFSVISEFDKMAREHRDRSVDKEPNNF